MLETSKVFIDTEYFRSKEFNFENATFEKFQVLCEDKTFELFISSVVKQEVERQIKTKVNDVRDIIKKFSRKKHIFNMISTLDINNILALQTDNSLTEIAISKFTNYLEDCGYTLITSNDINLEKLLSLYFNQKAPFSNAKKSEFPDAISLLSIENHIQNDSIYVISGDNDLKDYCENINNLIYVPSLDNLLDIYNKDLGVLSKAIKDYLFINSNEVESLITDSVEKCEAYNFSTWEDAELKDFTIVNIGEILPNLITVDEDYALVHLDIEFEFEVLVEGHDYDRAYHDREDEKYYFLEKITITDYIIKSLTIEIELTYPNGIESIKIASVNASCSNGLRFEVDQNSEYSY